MTSEKITLGTGRLDWPNQERAGNTYSVVSLDTGPRGAGMAAAFDALTRFDETMHGQRGALSALVLAPNPDHVVDADPAAAGELVALGRGTLQIHRSGPGHAAGTPWTAPDPATMAPVLIGILPDGSLADHEPRMDVDALYRVAWATVTLLFAPEPR